MLIRKSNNVILSYKNLRRVIGIPGIALPVLCLTGLFITNITGILGLGIALCPCEPIDNMPQHVGYFNLNPEVSNEIHVTCAVLFFSLLSINAIILFTKSNTSKTTKDKKNLNIVYISCGMLMLGTLLSLFILRFVLGVHDFNTKPIVFFLESVMLCAFGVSGLVKGDVMFRDKVSADIEEIHQTHQPNTADDDRNVQ